MERVTALAEAIRFGAALYWGGGFRRDEEIALLEIQLRSDELSPQLRKLFRKRLAALKQQRAA